MKQRLVIFCSEIDADLEKVRQALAELSDQHGLAELEIEPVDGPEALSQSGWMTISISRVGATATDLSRFGGYIEELVQSCSRALSEDVLGVFVDTGDSYARACLQSPGGFPRSSEGELFHVLRQAASWLETDAVQLLRYFSASASRSAIGAVDLSDVQMAGEDKEVEPEMDDDDRFVEAKLKLARELMERYLSSRK